MQVIVEVPEFVKLSRVTVAVTVTGPAVARTQVASPFVASCALLIFTFPMSDTVQVARLGVMGTGSLQLPSSAIV